MVSSYSDKRSEKGMEIAIGADHGGYELKERLSKFLRKKGYRVSDFGTKSRESCDYPPIGYKVARGVSSGRFDRGVLICKTGIGSAIVGNKVPGVRAAVCHTKEAARYSREHNDLNLIVFGARFISPKRAKEVLLLWLNTPFLGGRHKRRVGQIGKIEKRLKRES